MGNADTSRARILEAAMVEFSAYGTAGARVDRIAKAAGCNKTLIYIYFENKERLFTTILQKHIARVYEELPFTPDDLPGYAARVFDFAMANPDLMRLMAWFALERTPDSSAERAASRDKKLSALKKKAQSASQVGATFSPCFLLTAIMTLATAWTAANPFGPSLDPAAHKHPSAVRRKIALAIQLLSESKGGGA
jgi:AcrR family transcriptional regulator